MTAASWDALEVVLITGKRVRVVAECVIGPYAIHPKLWGGEPHEGNGWAITHRESGLCVYSTNTQEDARKVAHWLEDNNTMPTDVHEFVAWRNKLTAKERTDILAGIMRVAPRHHTPGDVAAAVFAARHRTGT